MTLISSLQTSIDSLPLEGASLLVDAFSEDPAEASGLCDFLRAAIGRKGTIVMPTFTQLQTLADNAPEPVAFHRDLPIDAHLGVVPEVFRHHPASLRTDHPTNSFAAFGAQSQELLSTNRDNNPLGPIKKLNLTNALSLRIGQPICRSSALLLAEEQTFPNLTYRSTAKRINLAGFEERVVVQHAANCTVGYANLEQTILRLVSTEFPALSETLHLVPVRVLVQAARAAIKSSPDAIICGREHCITCDRRRRILDGEG